jgi:general secretion pathway protein E
MPVGGSSPASFVALDKITCLLGAGTEPVAADPELVQQLINEAYGAKESGIQTVITDLQSVPSDLDSQLGPGRDLLDSAAASDVTKLVNLVLLDAVKRRASDVHVQPFEDRLLIRLRIDGVLYDYVQPPRHLQDEIASRIKVMGRMNIAEKRLAQDGRTTVKVGDKVVDLRISSLPTCYGERLVLRLLDKSARLYRLPELGMEREELEQFRALIQRNHGIILVTGPTGSGKSTTLYAALQELNSKELNIVTLEDHIEYQLPGISQTQVTDKKGMTFATGLRTVLRQDPDIIMVGEIRDLETARMAIQSSLTGHLVFSTLHTNDAAGAIARLMDLGVESYLVAGSLLGVLAQRLLRKVCVHCRRGRELTTAEGDAFSIAPGSLVYDAVGCTECQHTGYHDRVGIFEFLRVTERLHDLLATNPKSSAIKSAARGERMRTLREDAVAKMLAGLTTLEEVMRMTHSDGQL